MAKFDRVVIVRSASQPQEAVCFAGEFATALSTIYPAVPARRSSLAIEGHRPESVETTRTNEQPQSSR